MELNFFSDAKIINVNVLTFVCRGRAVTCTLLFTGFEK